MTPPTEPKEDAPLHQVAAVALPCFQIEGDPLMPTEAPNPANQAPEGIALRCAHRKPSAFTFVWKYV